MRSIAVIVNSEGGTVREENLDAEALRKLFREAGAEAEVHLVPGDRIAETAKVALARKPEAVVAGGGDGTIRAVAGLVLGTGIPFGVLPLGTLNHFARDLGIPVDLPGAVRVIVEGFTRDLDAAEVNGEVFVNNSMLGLYPPVVRMRDWQRRTHKHGKWRATISALLKVLPSYPMLHLRLRSDEVDVHRETRLLFVGNNEYEMSAFGFGARERFDSGSLYVYVARSPSRLGLVYLGLLSLFRDVKGTERFERFCLPELTIETRKKKALAVYLDGEVVTLSPPLRYRVRPRELRVLLPRDLPAS